MEIGCESTRSQGPGHPGPAHDRPDTPGEGVRVGSTLAPHPRTQAAVEAAATLDRIPGDPAPVDSAATDERHSTSRGTPDDGAVPQVTTGHDERRTAGTETVLSLGHHQARERLWLNHRLSAPAGAPMTSSATTARLNVHPRMVTHLHHDADVAEGGDLLGWGRRRRGRGRVPEAVSRTAVLCHSMGGID